MINDVPFNTDNIPTYEVPVAPLVADHRTWVNGAATVIGAAATIAQGMAGSFGGFSWFAPALAGLGLLNTIFGYFSKKNVVSKNVKVNS